MKHNHLSTPRKIAAMGRQILLPAFVFLLLLSCSKDDDSEPGIIPVPVPPAATSFLKATIGGAQYTFDKFVVETQTVVEPDYTYVDLKVTASIVDDPTKEIIFNLEQDVPGTETIYYFYLNNNDVEYDTDHDSVFSTNVTVNADKRIIGTFSGTIGNFDGGETIELQNGSFDITY